MLAVQAKGRSVTTIEGLAQPDGVLHPMQEAFREHHGLQCGFCTPGMVMMGVDIARRNPGATEELVRHELEGNICRCTGYQGIVEAILSVANPRRRAEGAPLMRDFEYHLAADVKIRDRDIARR